MKNDDTTEAIRELIELSVYLEKKISRYAQSHPHGIVTPLQMKSLSIISQKGNINMSNLAKELIISKQQCTVIINTLTKKGYIVRQTNPKNRREVLLTLTDSAEELINTLNSELENLLYGFYDVLSIDDKKNIILASKTIKDIINKTL